MGCGASAPEEQDPVAKQKNIEISKQLDQERKQIEKERLVKLLLLGAGESGKSTILKQMTLIYGSGFSDEQVRIFREAMHMNLLISMGTLIKAMDTLKIPYEFKKPVDMEEATRRMATLPELPQIGLEVLEEEDDDDGPVNMSRQKSLDSSRLLKKRPSVEKTNEKQARSSKLVLEEGKCVITDDPVSQLAAREYFAYGGTERQPGLIADCARQVHSFEDPVFGFNLKMAMVPFTIEAIKTLWEDSGIQYCFSRSNEFQLVDSCAYIMENIDRISDVNFTPTNDDILIARIMTIGVTETRFKVGKMSLAIYDVGGQRSERKKWAQFFDDTQSIIYLVAISAYDQVCMEDNETNRIVESLNLFSSICNHPLFKKTDIVLFLNKIDLFQEKVKKRAISLYFPDYEGPNDFQESAKYFVKRFKDINKYPNDKKIYPHLTHCNRYKPNQKNSEISN
ncbi:guanine nucleotide binding protein, alpha subunit [Obelidium mucronatum]|nr:guanine nucleotide binding protein, alpha subunit [Obelidium mucronatum]